MEILKKDILKEIKEKSRNNLNRGIDISVSILKHEFPFITGWDYKNDPETYRTSIYLVLMADMNLASEFYSSPIRNVYKRSSAKVSYPFSPLEISTELNEEEKYELYKVIQNSLLEIYDEIPSELRHEFESYASELKLPKELYIDEFAFEKPKEDINENKKSDEIQKNIEVINLILNEISWDGLCEIWVEYNEVDGDYEIRSKSTKRHFDYDIITNELGYLENTLRSMGLRTYIYAPWYVENCEDEVEFLNEDYSPAGKEVTPNEIVVHKSNPIFRNSIMSEGLKAKAGECYRIYVGYGKKCIPAIFATNSKNKRAWFDSTYDDDIWFIDTTKIPDVKWFKDRHYESTKKHIVTFQDIPRDALTLFYEGTGKSQDLMNESKERPNKEVIINIINELILPNYKDDICNVEYIDKDERLDFWGEPSFNQSRVTITFIGEKPLKIKERDKYDNIMNEIWDTIHNYVGISVDLYARYTDKCEKENINESVMGPEYLDLIKDIVEIYEHEDFVCDIEVSYDDEDGMYSIMVTFDSEELLKIRDRGAYARQIRNRIGDDIVKYIPDFLNFYVGSYVRHCKESINETRTQVPSSEYNSLEKIINLEMKEKYSWWKDIQINSLEYIEFVNKLLLIDAEITVDEEWGGNQWREYNPHMEFPGNKGWEDNDEYELVSLGDIIGSNLANEIREIFSETLKYTLNFDIDMMPFRTLYLIFE